MAYSVNIVPHIGSTVKYALST